LLQAVAVRAAAEREAKAILDAAELDCESMRQAAADEAHRDPFARKALASFAFEKLLTDDVPSCLPLCCLYRSG